MFDFPNNPATNQVVIGTRGENYVWDGWKWVAGTGPTPPPGTLYLPVAGGSMSGPLILAGNATQPLEAVPLQQIVPAINPVTGTYGIHSFPSTDIYQSPDSYAMTGSMTVRGQPYGYYDTGTLLSLVSTTLPLSSSRAGIAGGWEDGVSAIAGYVGLDLVTLYSSVVPSPPPLVLHNVTYDAGHVYPQVPLTAQQMLVLRKNMYVITNSIDSTVSTTPAVLNGHVPEHHYASYVTGWATDGTSITVVGWTVPGSGHTAGGQVPPVGTLDPGAPNATAYFGAPTNVFAANFMLQANTPGQPDSRVKTLQGLEVDMQNYGTIDYEIAVSGLALNYTGINGAKATADSYGATFSGFPNGIIVNYTDLVGLQVFAGTALISNVFNINHWWSPPPWAGTPETMLLWESQGYVDSNLLRLQCWTSRDSAAGGWSSASLHLGLRIDGDLMAVSGGSLHAHLVWNPQGYQGGLQIQTAAGVAGLTVDNAGNALFHGEILDAASAVYAQTLYAQGTTRGGFIGSIQSAGTTPSVIGLWNQDSILHIGQGAGDIPGTPSSTYLSLDTGGNLSLAGALTLGSIASPSTLNFTRIPDQAANDAAAATAGVPVGGTYRNGSALMVRVT